MIKIMKKKFLFLHFSVWFPQINFNRHLSVSFTCFQSKIHESKTDEIPDFLRALNASSLQLSAWTAALLSSLVWDYFLLFPCKYAAPDPSGVRKPTSWRSFVWFLLSKREQTLALLILPRSTGLLFFCRTRTDCLNLDGFCFDFWCFTVLFSSFNCHHSTSCFYFQNLADDGNGSGLSLKPFIQVLVRV